MQSAGLQCIYYEWRKCFLQLSLYFGLLELLSSHYRAGGEQMQHQINHPPR